MRELETSDFGFSIVDEVDLQQVIDTNMKAKQIRAMIMPLLNNLKANPEKDIIKWEGARRVKTIDEFIEKLDKLVDG